jgi:hypothetical protein
MMSGEIQLMTGRVESGASLSKEREGVTDADDRAIIATAN